MKVEILCTGDEILTGKTVNTNYSHMAQRLGEAGLTVYWGTTVGDDRESLVKAFQQASTRADAVIVNGGLGPTVDDLSQEVAAQAADVELELHETWLERMEQWYTKRGRVMPPNNRKQAMLPAGAEFIDNPIGTACGFAITIGKARFMFTPGVPREMRRMIDEQVLPRLLKISGIDVVTRLKRFHSFGVGESRADQILLGIEDMDADGAIKLGFQAHYPQLEIKLAVQAKSDAEIDAKLNPVIDEVRSRIGNSIFAEDAQTMEQQVLDALKSSDATLATMEMFTGGSITSRLMRLRESEDAVKRAVVSKDLDQLHEAAGLDASQTTDASTITVETAMHLAQSLRDKASTTHCLVVLIVLDEAEDTIEFGGDIFIAIATPQNSVVRHARLVGGREWVRLGAVEMGLDTLRRQLQNLPVDEKIDFEKH